MKIIILFFFNFSDCMTNKQESLGYLIREVTLGGFPLPPALVYMIFLSDSRYPSIG